MPPSPPPVSLFVRRHDELPLRFALRFVANGGRSMLRVPRGGVVLATPASERGFEDDLTLEAVREAELVWTARDGRQRTQVRLRDLDAELLRTLPPDQWQPLVLRLAGSGWTAHFDDLEDTAPLSGGAGGGAGDGAIALGGSLDEGPPPDTDEVAAPSLPPALLTDLANTAAETSTAASRLARQGAAVAEWLGDHHHPAAARAWTLQEELDALRLQALECQERIRRLKALLDEA